MTMYSDEWLQKGYHKSKRQRLKIKEPIDYIVWLDETDQPVGITLNFEYADDVHFEFKYEDFLKLIAILGGNKDFVLTLCNYFEGKHIYEFSNFLDNNFITYKKIAFY
jgi:hypothetical protein